MKRHESRPSLSGRLAQLKRQKADAARALDRTPVVFSEKRRALGIEIQDLGKEVLRIETLLSQMDLF